MSRVQKPEQEIKRKLARKKDPVPQSLSLKEYLNQQKVEKGGDYPLTDNDILLWFKSKCGVSTVTLGMLCRGGKLRRKDKAESISRATEGRVAVADLLEAE
jgi:hypothetical protein